MIIEPNGTRVFAKIIKTDEKTAGGIITSVNGPVATETAVIESTGEDCIKYKVDDEILLSKRCGTPIGVDGVEYIVIKEVDILGLIKEEVASE